VLGCLGLSVFVTGCLTPVRNEVPLAAGSVGAVVVDSLVDIEEQPAARELIVALLPALKSDGIVVSLDATKSPPLEARVSEIFLAASLARIEKVHREDPRNSFLPTSEPAIRCRDNSLSRIYLWIMKTQAEKAGVVWKDVEDIRPSYQPSVRKLDGYHPLHSLHQYSDHPGLLEGILTTDLFWRQVVPHMHDSRWSGDVFSGSRKRQVIFDGRAS